MALSAKVGSFNTGTGIVGSTVVVNDVGFLPKVVFFWWNGRIDTVDATGRRTHQRGFGVGVSATKRFYATSLAQDTPTSMVTNRTQGNAQCIGITTTADAIDGLMDVQSFESTGFTLVVDDVFTASYRVHYLALGGSDISNVDVNAFTKIDTVATQDITSLAFQPNFVMILQDGQQSNNNSISVDGILGIGIATASGAGNQFVYVGGSNDASANAQTVSYAFDNEIIANLDSGVTATESRAQFVQFLSNGFQLSWLENTVAAKICNFVAIQFSNAADVKPFSVLTRTDANDINASSLNMFPRAGLLLSHGKAKNTQDAVTDHDKWSCGAFTSDSARVAMSIVDQDAAGTAVVGSGLEHDEVYSNLTTAAAIDALMDVKTSGIINNQVTFVMDDTEASVQSFVWGVMFGDGGQSLSSAGAIASAEAFGTDVVKNSINSAGAVASAETFGVATVTGTGGAQDLTSAGAITSTEAFGIDKVNLNLTGAGQIASAEVFGTDKVNLNITGTGAITSAQIFGIATISYGDQYLSSVGAIISAESFGTTIISIEQNLSSVGAIASAEAFGTASLVFGNQYLSGMGQIVSTEAFGTDVVELNIVTAGTISSSETFGTASISVEGGTQNVMGAGAITSTEAFGTGALSFGNQYLATVGAIASIEAFGSPELDLSVILTGIASVESFGTAILFVEQNLSSVGGIVSGETFGVPTVSLLGGILYPVGIVSAEAFGVTHLSFNLGTPTFDRVRYVTGQNRELIARQNPLILWPEFKTREFNIVREDREDEVYG